MVEIEAKQVYTVECPSLDCAAPHKVVRNGWRNGDQQYLCRGCGKKFAATGQALRKQFPADQIAAAVDMYYSGMSYKQVAENMEDVFDVPEPSKDTVHNWVKGYTGLALRYLRGEVGEDGTPTTATGKRILADVGDHWVADELVLRVGGRKYWCWNVMDKKTRYVLAARLSSTRDTNDAIAVFEKALANAKAPPKKITTDGLGSYVDAAKAVFPNGTQHEVSDGIYELVNNNMSERLQGAFRQRTKTQRGLEARRTGQDYLDGWVLDYNHFKDHEAHKGQQPADAAGVSAQVPWDSWEDITRLGGEVAEIELKSHTAKRKKPGPKPQITDVQEAVKAYLAELEIVKAHARRTNRKTPTINYVPKTKGKKDRGKANSKKW